MAESILNLSPELAEAAKEELGETPERRTDALRELREHLLKLPEKDRPQRIDDDAYLVRYLRHAKFDVKKAARKMQSMEKFLKEHADQLQNISGEEFRDFYGAGFMRVLPTTDRLGRRISILIPRNMGKFQGGPDTFLRWNVWSTERIMRDPAVQVKGTVILENFENTSLWQMMGMGGDNPGMSRKVMSVSMRFMQDCSPMRLGGIYVLHEPAFMSVLWAIVRPFMTKKMRQRVCLMGSNLETLHELVDPKCLPTEFGGSLGGGQMDWLEEQIALEKQGQ